MVFCMDPNFCENWEGTGNPPENKYCRVCPSKPCNDLWAIVKSLAASNNFNGIKLRTKTGKPYRLFTTRNQDKNICKFQSLSADRAGVAWNIPKEDFLYVLKMERMIRHHKQGSYRTFYQ